ncbi:Variant-specific surface protein, partial [Giardia duodenalis]
VCGYHLCMEASPGLMFPVIWCLIVNALAACKGSGPHASSCTECDTVSGIEICIQCNANGNVPIDGTCKKASNPPDSSVTDAGCKTAAGSADLSTVKVCGQCGEGYFLYKGGCYTIGGPIGGLICADTVAAIRSTPVPGVCTKCRENYFKNPSATDNTHQSCIACNETAVTDGADTYKGVVDCSRCSPPATPAGAREEKVARCTKCITAKYLSTTGTCVASCTQDVQFSTEDDENGKRCFLCSDATNKGVTGCAKCTYTSPNANATCTECTSDYLKTVDGATTCVTDCGPGFFKNDKGGDSSNLKLCSPCAANCLTCADGTAEKCKSCTAGTHFLVVVAGSQGKCLSCGDATSGVPNCAKCTLPSGAAKPTCSECGFGYKLEGGACVSAGGVNLSTGAIAGISVAAVVVVGGLVGFLCWWFICRGKA